MWADSACRKLHKFVPVIGGLLFAARPELLLVVEHCLTSMVFAGVVFILFHQEILVNTTCICANESFSVSSHHNFFFLSGFSKIFGCFLLLLFFVKIYSGFMHYFVLSRLGICNSRAFPKA